MAGSGHTDENFYSVLGVDSDATPDEIRTAYRERVKETHPDQSDAPDAGERFRRVKRAEEVLTDPAERARYDRLGHERYVADEALGGRSGTEGPGDTTPGGRTGSGGAGAATGDGERRQSDRGGRRDHGGRSDDHGRDHWRRNGREGRSRRETDRNGREAGGDRRGGGQNRRAAGRNRGGAGGRTDRGGSDAGPGNTGGSSAGRRGGTGRRRANGGGHGPPGGGPAGGGVAGVSTDPITEGLRRGVRFFDGRQLEIGASEAVFGFAAFFLYPIFLASSVAPSFPLPVNLVLALCLLLTVGYLLATPEVGTIVFGTWTLFAPVLFLFTDQPLLSWAAFFLFATTAIPFGLSLVIREVLRAP